MNCSQSEFPSGITRLQRAPVHGAQSSHWQSCHVHCTMLQNKHHRITTLRRNKFKFPSGHTLTSGRNVDLSLFMRMKVTYYRSSWLCQSPCPCLLEKSWALDFKGSPRWSSLLNHADISANKFYILSIKKEARKSPILYWVFSKCWNKNLYIESENPLSKIFSHVPFAVQCIRESAAPHSLQKVNNKF